MKYDFSDRVKALKPSAIREIFKYSADPSYIPLSAGNPSAEAFPIDAVREISNKLLMENPASVLQYSITEGYTPLRDYLSIILSKKHGDASSNDSVIITSGAQQAIDLFSKAVLNEGDTVLCEEPSFIGSLNTFRSYNARLVGVKMTDDGVDIEQFEKAVKANKNAKFFYTIPNFQNPFGISTSFEKRKKIYEIAKNNGILILEDNPYGELYYDKSAVCPDIKSLDTEGIVIYVGSFSKVISPGMRVGFCKAHPEIIKKMTVCKQGQDVHTNIWAQAVSYRFITEYGFDTHLSHLRELYKKKAEYTVNLLEKNVSPYIKFSNVRGGLFVWCELPDFVEMEDFCKRLLAKKVCVVPGTAFLTNENERCNGFRINFSTPTDAQLAKGIEIIGETLREYIK